MTDAATLEAQVGTLQRRVAELESEQKRAAQAVGVRDGDDDEWRRLVHAEEEALAQLVPGLAPVPPLAPPVAAPQDAAGAATEPPDGMEAAAAEATGGGTDAAQGAAGVVEPPTVAASDVSEAGPSAADVGLPSAAAAAQTALPPTPSIPAPAAPTPTPASRPPARLDFDELFGDKGSAAPRAEARPKVDLFGNSPEHGSLFGATKKEPLFSSTAGKSGSLFGDDDDPLFASLPSSKTNQR